MICDEYSKEKEGTMTVISNGSIKKIFMLLMIQSIYFVKSRKKKN